VCVRAPHTKFLGDIAQCFIIIGNVLCRLLFIIILLLPFHPLFARSQPALPSFTATIRRVSTLLLLGLVATIASMASVVGSVLVHGVHLHGVNLHGVVLRALFGCNRHALLVRALCQHQAQTQAQAQT
jgi:hypothetical protein